MREITGETLSNAEVIARMRRAMSSAETSGRKQEAAWIRYGILRIKTLAEREEKQRRLVSSLQLKMRNRGWE